MRRVLLILLVLLGASLGPPVPASAAAEWCDTDPLLLITTPGGTTVPIFILVGAQGITHLPAAQAASLLATTGTTKVAEGGRATRVTVAVTVPDDLFGRGFPVRAAASTGPLGTGMTYATDQGRSSAPLILEFTLNIP